MGTLLDTFPTTMNYYIFLLVLAIACAHVKAAEFCYHDALCAPSRWGGTCASGRQQSPIRLSSAWSPVNIFGTDTITFNDAYKANIPNAVIKNNGHTVQISANEALTSTMQFTSSLTGSLPYNFGQCHCHWGAEHTYDINFRPDIECHIVHYRSDFSSITSAVASNATGALAIFGIQYTRSSTQKPLNILSPDQTFQLFPDNIAKVVDPENGVKKTTGTINIYNMIPRMTSGAGLLGARAKYQMHVHNYMGSLTTPGCNEGMNWLMFRQIRQISTSQYQAFRTLLDEERKPLYDNYRPAQPLNGRTVRHLVMNEVQPTATRPVLSPVTFWGNNIFPIG